MSPFEVRREPEAFHHPGGALDLRSPNDEHLYARWRAQLGDYAERLRAVGYPLDHMTRRHAPMDQDHQAATDPRPDHNPHRHRERLQGMTANTASPAPPESPIDVHDRAQGFDAPMLDDLLRGRWVEGFDAGRLHGFEQARRNYADVYDEGWRSGVMRQHSELGQRYGSRLHAAHELADALVVANGLSIDEYRSSARAITLALAQVLDEFNEGPFAAQRQTELREEGVPNAVPAEAPQPERAFAAQTDGERVHDVVRERRGHLYRLTGMAHG